MAIDNAQPLTKDAETVTTQRKWRKLFPKLITHTILILMAVLMMFPLVWLVSSSLKAPTQQYVYPPQFIPRPFYPRNFVDLFALAPMGKYLLNSFKIALFSVVGMTISSSLAGFAFARMRFRGKETIFAILLATMMIPGAITVIPTFVIMRSFGWIDTHLPLIIPNFFGSAYFVFLFRQNFRSIPQDMMDSAKIDGAGYFDIYWRIFMPLSIPILTTVALLTFLWSWNDLFSPLIYLNTQDKMTVQLGLAFLRGRAGTGVEKYGIVMAGSLLGILPMLILYIFGQKYFVQGLARTGMKG
jgi:multiple sugar transport system permease protein